MKDEKSLLTISRVALVIFLILIVKIAVAQNKLASNESLGLSYSYESSRLMNDRMFVKGNYILGRRSFEIGISLDSYKMNTQGMSFEHRVFLNKKKNEHADFNLDDYNLRSFILYKFVMFSSTTKSLRQDQTINVSEKVTSNSLTSPSFRSIEHYVGIGAEYKLFEHLFMEAMGVAGVNIIKNNSETVVINKKMLPKSDMGLSWNISLSMNYYF